MRFKMKGEFMHADGKRIMNQMAVFPGYPGNILDCIRLRIESPPFIEKYILGIVFRSRIPPTCLHRTLLITLK